MPHRVQISLLEDQHTIFQHFSGRVGRNPVPPTLKSILKGGLIFPRSVPIRFWPTAVSLAESESIETYDTSTRAMSWMPSKWKKYSKTKVTNSVALWTIFCCLGTMSTGLIWVKSSLCPIGLPLVFACPLEYQSLVRRLWRRTQLAKWMIFCCNVLLMYGMFVNVSVKQDCVCDSPKSFWKGHASSFDSFKNNSFICQNIWPLANPKTPQTSANKDYSTLTTS